MRKFYITLLAMVLALPAVAQQIPNSGFGLDWVDCVPWTSDGNTETKGKTPESWTISHVIGINTLGATEVGGQAEGYESQSAVKVYNSANPLMSTQIVPGYVTLGTTWSTSVMGQQNDGGSFGGIEFAGRPEKITFMYKFEKESENDQPANAIAYLWKGTYTQKDVPGCIAIFGAPKAVDMVNRDRNILGIETAKGGEVTKTDDAELIAVGKTVITETTSDWVKGEIVFEYKSEATPEMLNIIFAANDYFSAENIKAGNALTVDNIKAIYAGEKQQYDGKLVIDMSGTSLTGPDGIDKSVIITKTSDTTCSFLLPNLSLGVMELGDIKVDEVNMTTEDGKTTYTGEVKGMSLVDGAIIADVNISGTSDAEGKISMTIDVLWEGINIKCTFNGALAGSGISSIVADDANAPVEYFNLQGVRVENPTPGLYIRRQGNKVSRIIIR